MPNSTFEQTFAEILQRDEPVTRDMALSAIEEWDSLAMMALMAYFDRVLGKKVTFDTLRHCRTVEDICALAE